MQGFRFMFTFLFRAIPGCLGSLGHFKNKFSDPIEQGQRHSATKRALATGRKAVRALVRKISHWFFRRTKALIKEQLPKKDDRVRLDVRLTNTFITYCPFIIFIITFFFNSIRFIWLKFPSVYVCMCCFIEGGILLYDRVSADSVSGSARQWRCDITPKVIRKMWLSQQTHPQKLLL